jgi:DNA-binding MarR family transcriptional regulator
VNDLPPDAHRIHREYLTAIVLHGQAVADAMGITAADAHAMNLIALHSSVTAGQLAERTGLTSGAATRLIDRLVRAGFARRVPDPADRRRVRVEAVPGEDANAVLDAIRSRMVEVFAGYDAAELELLFGFFAEATTAFLAASADTAHQHGAHHVHPATGAQPGARPARTEASARTGPSR